MTESWRSIPGHPGYEASDLGRIRNAETRRVLTPCIHKPNGYFYVRLNKSGTTRFKVHRLVLETFVGPRPNGMVGRHFPDRDPANNALENISWSTQSTNILDKLAHGTMAHGVTHGSRTKPHTRPRGERNCWAKLTDARVRLMRFLRVVHGATIQELADLFGVSWPTTYNAATGRTWTHLPLQAHDEAGAPCEQPGRVPVRARRAA